MLSTFLFFNVRKANGFNDENEGKVANEACDNEESKYQSTDFLYLNL